RSDEASRRTKIETRHARGATKTDGRQGLRQRPRRKVGRRDETGKLAASPKGTRQAQARIDEGRSRSRCPKATWRATLQNATEVERGSPSSTDCNARVAKTDRPAARARESRPGRQTSREIGPNGATTAADASAATTCPANGP